MIIGSKRVGIGQPAYIVAEGGINHNGYMEIAYKLVDAAAEAGANAIKFQKRTPRLSTPRAEWDKVRDTPWWGLLSYIEYREKIELDITEHARLMKHAHSLGLGFIDSVWDMQSLADVISIGVDAIKIPSAMLTNIGLIESSVVAYKPVILSTGMSTDEEISTAVSAAVDKAESKNLAVLHCTSTYPCSAEELNLLLVRTLQEQYPLVIGYSNHSPGIIAAVSAVTLGAKIVEAHITLDRTAWGTDQAASIEPGGFKRMVDYIRTTEKSLGDGIKQVYDSELPARQKLRGTV